MNKWVWRMIGILMLVLFMALFAQMQRRLMEIQQQRPPASSR